MEVLRSRERFSVRLDREKEKFQGKAKMEVREGNSLSCHFSKAERWFSKGQEKKKQKIELKGCTLERGTTSPREKKGFYKKRGGRVLGAE